MTIALKKTDYIKILKYYNLSIPKSSSEIKKQAEDVLAFKLCRCIKKESPMNEPKAIGVCTRTIFKRKNLNRGAFTCKRGRSVEVSKMRKRASRKANMRRWSHGARGGEGGGKDPITLKYNIFVKWLKENIIHWRRSAKPSSIFYQSPCFLQYDG